DQVSKSAPSATIHAFPHLHSKQRSYIMPVALETIPPPPIPWLARFTLPDRSPSPTFRHHPGLRRVLSSFTSAFDRVPGGGLYSRRHRLLKADSPESRPA